MNTSILAISAIIAAVGTVGIVIAISFSTPVHAGLDIAWMGSYSYSNSSGDWGHFYLNSTRLNTDTTYFATIALSYVEGAGAHAMVSGIHTPQGWIAIQTPWWTGHNVDTIRFEIGARAAAATAVFVIFKVS
jgi:hypothetical protein